MRKQLVALFSLVFVSAVIASGQERAILPAVSQQSPADTPAAPVRAEVLALGVYHMICSMANYHFIEKEQSRLFVSASQIFKRTFTLQL